MNKQILLLLLVFIAVQKNVSAQGCSDAGFCTMGAMKPDQPFNKKVAFKLRSMEVSFYRGKTTLTPIIYVATLDMTFSVGRKNFVQVKVPYHTVQQGSLGETAGLSDLSLCFTRTIHSTNKYDINWSLGGKLPSNNSDLKEDGKPLPMYYQTSLGTYDFITGISLISRKWLFATGIQHPFNANKNEFTWGAWADYQNQDYLQLYPASNKLKRGTDIMLRVERNFRFSQVNFSLGLLPIYRITPDEVEKNGEYVKIDESLGLALSGIGTVGYNFNVKSGIKLLVGTKIVQREQNADGLSRDFVTSIGYSYRF